MTHSRPPGLSTSQNSSIARLSCPSSSFTSILMAWKVLLAGCGPSLRAFAGTAALIISTSWPVEVIGSFFSGLYNKGRDTRSPFFFSIRRNDPRQLFLIIPVYHVVSRKPIFLIHPHIQRSVVHIGKSPLRIVQLKRRNSQVQNRSVKSVYIQFSENLLDIRIVALNKTLLTRKGVESLFCRRQSISVPVDTDQHPLFLKASGISRCCDRLRPTYRRRRRYPVEYSDFLCSP